MHYKTIVLGLIEDRPELYERLRSSKRLLTALEAYAIELKASHEAWKSRMSLANPGIEPSLIASNALEMAVQELQDRLPCESPRDAAEPMSLDALMNSLRRMPAE